MQMAERISSGWGEQCTLWWKDETTCEEDDCKAPPQPHLSSTVTLSLAQGRDLCESEMISPLYSPRHLRSSTTPTTCHSQVSKHRSLQYLSPSPVADALSLSLSLSIAECTSPSSSHFSFVQLNASTGALMPPTFLSLSASSKSENSRNAFHFLLVPCTIFIRKHRIAFDAQWHDEAARVKECSLPMNSSLSRSIQYSK